MGQKQMQQRRQRAEIHRDIAGLAPVQIDRTIGQMLRQRLGIGQVFPFVADLVEKRRHHGGHIHLFAAYLDLKPQREPVIALKRIARLGR